MNILFIQLAAILAFAVCFFYAWRSEGARYAQQWFLIGYLYAVLLVSLLVVISQIAYNPAMVVFGAAPSLTVMLFPAVFYLAYAVAKRFAAPTPLRALGFFVLAVTPWLMLPLDALAIQSGWWFFPSESYAFLNGIPFYIPFAWGISSAAFAMMMGRIRKIRFRGNGQFFAMIIAAPLLAGFVLLLIALVQVVVDVLYALGGSPLLYLALALLLFAFPFAAFREWRIANGK